MNTYEYVIMNISWIYVAKYEFFVRKTRNICITIYNSLEAVLKMS